MNTKISNICFMTYCTNIKDSDSMMWISFSKKQHPYLQYFIHEQQFIIISFYPSNKSEKFSQILQPWWLSLRNFWGISRESFPVTDSLEILKKFPRIGLQDEIFLWDHSFETQFREIPEKFYGIFPHKIPQNFSRNILWKFLRNS